MQSYIKKINNTTKILKIFKNIFILLNCYEIIAWRGMEGGMGWQFDRKDQAGAPQPPKGGGC